MPTYRAYGSTPATSTACSTNAAWQYWITDTASSTATTTCDITWNLWTDETSTTITYGSSGAYQQLVYQQDPSEVEDARRELQQEFNAQREQFVAAQAAKQAAWAEAERKAEALLLDNLDDAQKRDYHAHKHIIIVGGYSGTRYRLRISRTGNIDVIDTQGRVSHRLCAHPREDMPDCDVVLVQKLMLEADERALLKVANRHPSFNREARVLPPITTTPS